MTYTPTDTANYNTASSSVSVTVNAKALTVTGITANDKVYDGTTTATLNTNSAALNGAMQRRQRSLEHRWRDGCLYRSERGDRQDGAGQWLDPQRRGCRELHADAAGHRRPTSRRPARPRPWFPPQNPSLQGSNVTFTATVTPVAPASTTPTGNVQFYTNGVALGSPVALTDGVASLSTADLPAGTNTRPGGSTWATATSSAAATAWRRSCRVVPSTPSHDWHPE